MLSFERRYHDSADARGTNCPLWALCRRPVAAIFRAPPAVSKEKATMSLFQRAHDIVAAKANKALDSAENPNEMLDYSYEQMLDHITRVRQALVDIAASRKRIELQEQQLGQGREDLAREALSRKAASQQQIDAMTAQHQELTEQEQKLGQTLSQLQQRVNSFRSQKEVMKAQYTAAQASASVNEEAAGISRDFGDSGAALARAQDKIATMQARAGALDELLQSGVLEDVGGDTDDIQKELDEAGSAVGVDKELAAMKAQLAIPPAAPELTSDGSPAAAPADDH
jgi:phage shock protein A